MKNIYILGLLFLFMILFSGRTFACGTTGNDQAKTVDCLQKIYWGLGSIQSDSSNAVSNTSITKEIQNVKQGILASNSSLASIEIKSGSNLVLLLKDVVLMNFIYQFIMIFGVGYLVSYNIFKK